MNNKSLAAALLAALLSACSSGPIHMAKIDNIIDLYAAAIRFGEFDKAQQFVNPAKRAPLDYAWLRNIHVSSYDIVYRKDPLPGSNIYEMTVKIHYFLEDEGVEKSIDDHQLWKYEPEEQKMTLETGLPQFR